MKKSFAVLLLLFLSIFSLEAQEWESDSEVAMERASLENRPIILVFKGSDWCAPCIKLEKEVFSTSTFQQYAKDNFVLLEADFPKRKKNALPEALQNHNNKLAEKYNKNGIFPLVVMLDKKGNVLGETGYKRYSPSEYISHLESFNR